jgi:hypothetical protein
MHVFASSSEPLPVIPFISPMIPNTCRNTSHQHVQHGWSMVWHRVVRSPGRVGRVRYARLHIQKVPDTSEFSGFHPVRPILRAPVGKPFQCTCRVQKEYPMVCSWSCMKKSRAVGSALCASRFGFLDTMVRIRGQRGKPLRPGICNSEREMPLLDFLDSFAACSMEKFSRVGMKPFPCVTGAAALPIP